MFNEIKSHEITVDIVILTIRKKQLKVLLVQRTQEPFKDKWALPGGFIRLSETLDGAAKRVLMEKTGVQNVYLEQLYTFGDPLRHPKSRVITVGYYALIRSDELQLSFDAAAAAQKAVKWHSIYELPSLAYDHKEIIEYAIERLRERLEYSPVAFQLLPKRFTLTQLQKTYEMILGKEIDKRNFRKKMLASEILTELEEMTKEGSKRPARLYSFNQEYIATNHVKQN